MKLSGAAQIWEALLHEGVEVVFGYPGGAILPAYDALNSSPIRHVLVRHEQGAAHMADGYARASGRVGVALATSGPGATNLVTGIATAMMDSSPMVCITGQVPSGMMGLDAFQETDILGITLPITKHSALVTRSRDIAPALHEAFRIARSGRPGPVVVDITKDAQQEESEFVWPRSEGNVEVPRPSSGDLDRAAEMIRTSRRPLILAGQGITLSGAEDLLRAFVDKTGIPVAQTLLGLSAFPATHPLCMGMMGMHGEAWVNQTIQESDLLLALGMRFDDRATGDVGTFAPRARKIQIDIDPSEIGKNVSVDIGLVGDLAGVLTRLDRRVGPSRRSAWNARIVDRKGAGAVIDIQDLPDQGRLFAAHVIHDLWRITQGRSLIVTDVGQHQMWEAQYFRHQRSRQLITSGGLGTMGFALPAAIGAHLARPEEEVWVIVGDGGFQMTASELSTCAQEGLNLKIAVINNGYLGMVRQWQQFFYEGRYQSTPLRNPDFVALAQAHGLRAQQVDRRRQVRPAVEAARNHQGTVLIDFRVEQEDSVYPMVPAGASLQDMIRRPRALVETAEDTF